jgi:hypothetical protein
MIGFGQGWKKTLQGSEGRDVQQTTDGGYIITGKKDNDMTLIKTDDNGTEQWSKIFGGTTNGDYGFSVQQTTDGGYIICGETYSFGNGNSDVYLIKTDDNGLEQWNQLFGGASFDGGYSVQQTTDGGYVITGYTESFGSGAMNVYLIKTDSNGVEQWHKTFGDTGTGNDGQCVQQTIDGGYIIAGYTNYDGSGVGDAYLIKTDSNGDLQWEKNFGDYGLSEIAYSVQQTTDNGFILLGYKEQQQMAPMDVYMIKTDDNGNEEWNQTFGSNGNDHGFSVKQTTDGGYIATGFYSDGDVYLIKTNNNGVEEWSKVFDDIMKETGSTGYSVQQTNDGGYIITGYKYNSINGEGIYLIKTDNNGNITSTFNIPTSNTNRQLENTVDILGRETKQTNQPLFYIYDDGTVEKRIVIE